MAGTKIFGEDSRAGARQMVLPWRRTLGMCWSNVLHRMGRFAISLLCIIVAVAFFMSAMTYQNMISRLMESDDIHTQAVLEKAGVFAHDQSAVRNQRDQRAWLMVLSGFLCLVGVTNTILMSVKERFREIGTLKCLGALDGFIVRLFLVENLLIGVLGSLVGCVLGYVLALLQMGAVFEFGLLSAGITTRAFYSCLPLALASGIVLSMVASVYPACVAARMRPVDAMRVEI